MTKKTTIRVKKQPGQFATIHKGFLADDRLGIDAMGLLTWMLARPDDWKHHIGHIAGSTGTAYNRVRSAMQRLVDCGYVLRSRVTDRKTGRVLRWEMTVFETPQLAETAKTEQPLLFEAFDTPKVGRKPGQKNENPRFQPNTPVVENPQGGLPETGNPHAGNPDSGNQHLLKTNDTNIDSTKQRRTNVGVDDSASGASDRLPASAGGSGVPVATDGSSTSAGAGGDREHVVVETEEQIVSSLISVGYFPETEARRLVRDHGLAACRQGLNCLRVSRRMPANRRGFVVRALQQGWEPAAGAAAVPPPDKPRPDPREVKAARLKQELQMSALRDRDVRLNALSDDEWHAHAKRLRPTFGKTVQQMLDEGRHPKTIETVRHAVHVDLTRKASA